MKLFERINAWLASRTVPADPKFTVDSVELNPATGLPTIAGVGTPDVARNPYGSARSHDSEDHWQRHDRWDSSGHDHFHHHHDSWSASSHDSWRE